MLKIKIILFYLIVISLFILRIPGCYSLLPTDEVDNGNPQDARTWKRYQLRWKAGTNPELENALHRYYSDCNPGCIVEYILDINLIDPIDYEMSCAGDNTNKSEKKLRRSKSVFLTEVDTCGTNRCVGTAIRWEALDGDLKILIANADALKIRIPVNSNETADPRTWKYFKILCRINDDSIFIKVQENMAIDPLLDSYALVVNISDPNPQNQFVVLGDESDLSSRRYAWSQLSKRVQNGLINWTKENKTNLNVAYLWW